MAITIPVIMLATVLGTYLKGKIITARITQFVCVTVLLPTIVILAFEGIIKGETVGTLLGGIAGFVLSNVGKYKNENTENTKKLDKPNDE